MDQSSSCKDQSKKPTYKYCIVPECRNTIRNAPDKVFFLVPSGVEIRRNWCKIMKRDVSPSTCLYCCEDHFDLDKIKELQEKQKTTLRLKKGIVPHKFKYQKETESQPPPLKKGFLKSKHFDKKEGTRKAPLAKQRIRLTDSTSENYLDDSSSSSFPEYIEDTGNKNDCEAGSSTSLTDVYTKNKIHVDKAIQSNSKKYYKNKSRNSSLCAKTKRTAVSSPFPVTSETETTSPLKIAPEPTLERELIEDNHDVASMSSTQPSLSWSSAFEPDTSSCESSWILEIF